MIVRIDKNVHVQIAEFYAISMALHPMVTLNVNSLMSTKMASIWMLVKHIMLPMHVTPIVYVMQDAFITSQNLT